MKLNKLLYNPFTWVGLLLVLLYIIGAVFYSDAVDKVTKPQQQVIKLDMKPKLTTSATLTVDLKSQTVLTESQLNDINCLAKNIYFEARSSNLADQVATADVVLNRVESFKYPNNICAVVQQAKLSTWWKKEHNKDVPIKHQCQFSWFCDGKSDEPLDIDAWESAKLLATDMYIKGTYRGITQGATHYHATYVNPYWASKLQLIGTIGMHKYYKLN